MHLLTVQIEGTAEAVLRKSNLFEYDENTYDEFSLNWESPKSLTTNKIPPIFGIQ
jgi:hypothetical protein